MKSSLKSICSINQTPEGISQMGYVKILNSICLLTFLTFFAANIKAQDMSGQWIGGFTSADNPGSGKTDFILELEMKGNEISGYSYTYFAIAGKRYYVICKLKGNFEKDSKYVNVKEVETVKTNTPAEFQNCLQTHQLTYLKNEDHEYLMGKWKPNLTNSNCGRGETQLERKLLKKMPLQKTSSDETITVKNDTKKTESKIPATVNPNTNIDKSNNVKPKASPQPEALKIESINNNFKPIPDNKTLQQTDAKIGKVLSVKEKEKLNERTRQILKTIDINSPSFRIDIYDNGQIDGDTVTIFLNDKLLVNNQKLTASPISFEIKVDPSEDIYDLVMYAESLGTIPPNTAFMVVTTPSNRYEINITSTEETSGTIRFKVKR